MTDVFFGVNMRVAFLLVAAITDCLLLQPAGASWQAKRKGDVCFAMVTPTVSRNSPLDRGKVYVALTHNRKENTWDVLTFTAGYPDVTKSLPSVVFPAAERPDKSFDLLPYRSAAFARAGKPEQDIVSAMLDNQTMRVTWRSADGKTVIVDDYDLAGLQQARQTIDQACNRPPPGQAVQADASAAASDLGSERLPRGNPFK